MAIIGRFRATVLRGIAPNERPDALRGEIRTLTLNLPEIHVRRKEFSSPSTVSNCDWIVTAGPDHVKAGAGWDKETDAGLRYIALRLDDPTFLRPIDCALFADGDTQHAFNLVWNRRRRDA